MPLTIYILGSGCSKCNELFNRVKNIVAKYNVAASVEKITDPGRIMSYGIYYVPALVVNEQIVSKGFIPSERKIVQFLNNFLTDNEKLKLTKKKQSRFSVIKIVLWTAGIGAIILFLLNINRAPENSSNEKNNSKTTVIHMSMEDSIHKMYNYSKKNNPFLITFLEFGSTGCRECKKMEAVMEEVRCRYGKKVNVVFYNVRLRENKKIAGQFGITMIPVQVILDKEAKEVFRHIGYFPMDSLEIQFKKRLH